MNRILSIAVAAGTLALAGCGSGDDGPMGLDEVAGTYHLETINNAPLPFTTDEDETYKAEILSSSITLREDRTFSWAFSGRSTDNGVATINSETFTGTYTLSGSRLTLTEPEGSTDATLADDTITIVVTGPIGTFTLRFRR